MNQKIDYAFCKSKYIDAEGAENIHVFEGHYDRNNNTFSRSEEYSCCGNCIPVPGVKYDSVAAEYSDKETRKKAREIAKNYEDNGITVCGRCVARLYSDEI